jgi:hypothetical protein
MRRSRCSHHAPHDENRAAAWFNSIWEVGVPLCSAAAALRAQRVSDLDQQLPLELERDTHVLVAAVGEKTTMGRIMGPTYGKLLPLAVSNPIYVDVDGGGFKPNGDNLGFPLPVKAGTAPAK